MIMLVKMC